jgi:GntR family transcriptional regulator, transcriptional repressor for pyruvate dehydrogenase complex
MDFLEDIKPIEKFLIIDKVIEKITGLIENGNLKPGDYLPGEIILSERLGISRTSLRQALKALNVMGVLEIAPGKKTFIKNSFSDILLNPFRFIRAIHSIKLDEIFEARRILEEGLVQITALKAEDSDIKKIKTYLDESEKNLENKEEFIYSEFRFHQHIFNAANNKILSAVTSSLNNLLLVLEKYEKDYLTLEDRVISLKQHKEIYNAINEKDKDKARLAMHNHLNTMELRLKKMEQTEKI